MNQMDTDKNGVVDWEEFLFAISNWLKQENLSKMSIHMLGKEFSPEEERVQLHSNVRNFFLQFKQTVNFDAIREALQTNTLVVDPYGFYLVEELSAQDKVNFFQNLFV